MGKFIDETGNIYGSLTVIERCFEPKGYWKCRCTCGQIDYIPGTKLRNGQIVACADCRKKNKPFRQSHDLEGQRFGSLVVLEHIETRNGKSIWTCQCDCGNITKVFRDNLMRGHTKSCGCINSQGNHTIKQFLSLHNIPFQAEYTFNNCRNQLPLRFDFCIFNTDGSIKFLLEYDGKQHYTYSNTGWDTKENYEKVKFRDNIKNEYCEENNYTLIRIKYSQNLQKRLEEIFYEYL